MNQRGFTGGFSIREWELILDALDDKYTALSDSDADVEEDAEEIRRLAQTIENRLEVER